MGNYLGFWFSDFFYYYFVGSKVLGGSGVRGKLRKRARNYYKFT